MNQEESEQNEVDGMKKGADSTGRCLNQSSQIFKICIVPLQ